MKYLLLLLISHSVYAEVGVVLNEGQYSFDHPTCLLRFDPKQEFASKIADALKEKGYKLHDYLPEGKLNPEDMYFTLTISRTGMFFKDCEVSYYIHEASGVKPISSDKQMLHSKTTRSLPRVTFSGDERCTRGIDDLFVNLPSCRSGRSLKSSR